MRVRDPNLAKVELIAAVLGPLREHLVFVGGCATGLLLTDPAAAPVRVTFDVDLVVQVEALRAYHGIEKEFAQLGFTRDMTQDAPICRWKYRGLEVDLMPTQTKILGFANRWYPLAVQTAQPMTLPSGAMIQLIAAPAFVATKFEAHADRGRGDLLASHDLEDIVNVIDGRPGLFDEVVSAESELRSYLASRCRELLAVPYFIDSLTGLIFPDDSLVERVKTVAGIIRGIAELG